MQPTNGSPDMPGGEADNRANHRLTRTHRVTDLTNATAQRPLTIEEQQAQTRAKMRKVMDELLHDNGQPSLPMHV